MIKFVPQDIFDNNIKCVSNHGSHSVCTAKKGEFFEKINYFQLHLAEDYKSMCASLVQSFEDDKSGSAKQVLLYLAVPPSVFLQSLRHFKTQCSFTEQEVSLKVYFVGFCFAFVFVCLLFCEL